MKNHSDLWIKSSNLLHEFSKQTFELIQNSSGTLTNPNITKKLSDLLDYDYNSPNDLKQYSIRTQRSGIKIGEENIHPGNIKLITDAYMSLILYYQKLDDGIYYSDIINYVFRSMKLGSEEARLLFPCLLRILDLKTELCDVFTEEARSVPTWMFLMWIPQLLGLLGSPLVAAIVDVVTRIAKTYPQAIMFLYNCSRESLNKVTIDSETEALVKK